MDPVTVGFALSGLFQGLFGWKGAREQKKAVQTSATAQTTAATRAAELVAQAEANKLAFQQETERRRQQEWATTEEDRRKEWEATERQNYGQWAREDELGYEDWSRGEAFKAPYRQIGAGALATLNRRMGTLGDLTLPPPAAYQPKPYPKPAPYTPTVYTPLPTETGATSATAGAGQTILDQQGNVIGIRRPDGTIVAVRVNQGPRGSTNWQTLGDLAG